MKFRTFAKAALFIVIGFVVGFCVERITNLTFETNINPIDFANIFLTLILAILISFFIEPFNEKNRVEKDLLIDQLKTIRETAKEIRSLLIDNFESDPLSPDAKSKMIVNFRTLSNQIELFLYQVKYSKKESSIDTKFVLLAQLVHFKRSLTGGGFDLTTFKYKTKSFGAYEKEYTSFIRKINDLIFDINSL